MVIEFPQSVGRGIDRLGRQDQTAVFDHCVDRNLPITGVDGFVFEVEHRELAVTIAVVGARPVVVAVRGAEGGLTRFSRARSTSVGSLPFAKNPKG
jgi:hypothetical protein